MAVTWKKISFSDHSHDAADLTSGAATDGQVLTADGSGGAAWEAAAGGGIVGDGIAKITVGTSAPVGPNVGDLWVDTN